MPKMSIPLPKKEEDKVCCEPEPSYENKSRSLYLPADSKILDALKVDSQAKVVLKGIVTSKTETSDEDNWPTTEFQLQLTEIEAYDLNEYEDLMDD